MNIVFEIIKLRNFRLNSKFIHLFFVHKRKKIVSSHTTFVMEVKFLIVICSNFEILNVVNLFVLTPSPKARKGLNLR